MRCSTPATAPPLVVLWLSCIATPATPWSPLLSPLPTPRGPFRAHVRELRSDVTTSASSTDDNNDAFTSWLRDSGARLDGISLHTFAASEGGRGVRALRDIAPGEAVLQVPLSLAIWDLDDGFTARGTFAAAAASSGNGGEEEGTKGFAVAESKRRQLTWTTRMAAALLLEKKRGAASGLAPYLRMLSPEPPPWRSSERWRDAPIGPPSAPSHAPSTSSPRYGSRCARAPPALATLGASSA